MSGVGERAASYGEDHDLSVIDRLGTNLNFRAALREARVGDAVVDIGCGYDARLGRALAELGCSVTAVDVSISRELPADISVIEGRVPEVLNEFADASFDVTYCVNLLEHLAEPLAALRELGRITKADGTVFVNVPSWRGRHFLEFAAFRLGTAPVAEMNDHKMYYDVRDLWPLAVEAGFEPVHITCRRVKGGLNTRLIVRRGLAERRR